MCSTVSALDRTSTRATVTPSLVTPITDCACRRICTEVTECTNTIVPAWAMRAHWDRNVGDRAQANCTLGRSALVMTSRHGHAEAGASSIVDGWDGSNESAALQAGAPAATRPATMIQWRIRVR